METAAIKFEDIPTIQVEELVEFYTRAGHHIVGKQIEDYGHALLIEVRKGPRKSYLGKQLLFPKNDMAKA